MSLKNRCLGLLLTVFTCFSLSAQEYGKVVGYLSDAINPSNPIFYADVQLIHGTDTLKTTTEKSLASFSFDSIHPGKHTFIVRCNGYQTYRMEYDLGAGENVIYVKLTPTENRLDAARIVTEVPVSRQAGDTTKYFAAAVRTMQSDDALAILMHLPDFEIQNGKILHKGETVKRTYVNGVLVFGDNPLTAFNHIEADLVSGIDAYREDAPEDRLKGLQRPSKDKVLNIRTKNALVKSVDMYVLAGAGADGAPDRNHQFQGRYNTGLTGNFFSEMFLADVNVNANNIGKESNAVREHINFSPQPLNEYREKTLVSAGFSKYWKDRYSGNHFSVRYTFDKDYGRSETTEETLYLEDEAAGGMKRSQFSSAQDIRRRHVFSTRLNALDTPLRSITFLNFFTLTRQDSYTKDILSGNMAAAIAKDEYTRLADKSWEDNGALTWRLDKSTAVLSPFVSVSYQFGRNDKASWVVDTTHTSSLQRNWEASRIGYHYEWDAKLGAEKAVSNNERGYTLVSAAVFVGGTRYTDVKSTWDCLTGLTNYLNTYNHSWNTDTQGLDFSCNASYGRTLVRANATVSHVRQKDTERIPADKIVTKDYFSVTPKLTVSFPNHGAIYLSTVSEIPSVEQIRDWVDDRNPYVLQVGNPALKAPYRMQLHVLLPFSQATGRLSAGVSLQYEECFHPVITRRTFYRESIVLADYGNYTVPQGAVLMGYENGPNSRNVSLSGRTVYLTKNRKLRLEAKLSGSYDHRAEYIANDLALLHSPVGALSGKIRFSPNQTFQVLVESNASLRWYINPAGTNLPLTMRITPKATVRKHFSRFFYLNAGYQGDYTLYPAAGLSPFFFHNLYATLAVELLGRRLSVSLTGADLLSRASSWSRTVNPDNIVTVSTPSYGRYFMLQVTYHFRKHNGGPFAGSLNDGRNDL